MEKNMARVQLTAPEHSLFQTKITVQIGDINYGNHLSNDAILRLVHEARLRWLKTGGFSEQSVGEYGLIMADVAIVYKNQGFYGDELLFDVAVGECSKAGFELYTTISRESDNKLIAIAKNGMVFFDYQQQKVGTVPECFYQFIGQSN